MKRLIPPAFLTLLALAAPCALALPGPTSAAFDKGAMFTVDGYTAAEALVGFPVLVRISEGSPIGFSYDDLHSKTNGDDIAFVDMNGAGLPYEIDTWNADGTSLIWVRLPAMTNGTQFVMCWGSDSSGRAVCADKPWTDYAGVWHMNETNNAVTTIYDSTENELHGTTVATSSPVSASDAKIGGARHVTSNAQNNPGLDSGITIDLSESTKRSAVDDLRTEFTASMWVRVKADFNYFYLVSRKSSDDYGAWGVQTLNATSGQVRYYSAGTAEAECASPILATALAAKNQWHKIDFCWKSDGTYVIYQDGANKLTGDLYNQTPAAQGSLNLSLGGALQNGKNKGGRGLNGDLDEVRLRAFVPSDNWAAADYATVTNENFLTAGTAQPYERNDDPIAGIQVSGVSYTNATVTATVVSRGGTATSADVTVELSASDDFATTLWVTNYTVNADNIVSNFSPTGLLYGTTYYVRAVVSNDLDAVLTTHALSFTTPTPGSPAGTATFIERGFTTLEATGVATAFGTGAQSATMRLEASTDADFATLFAGPETNATLDATAAVVVSGLAPDTTYHLRLRIQNDWGIDTFVALPDAATRAVPFAVTGIGWAFSPDGSTIDITFGVSDIYDGATGSATLGYGKTADSIESQGAIPFATPTNLLWATLPVTADPMYAKVVLSSMVAGQTFEQTFTASISGGSVSVSVFDIADHASAETAVRVHVGDTVTLPELSGNERYIAGNKLFGSLDGNVLTALRPGILGIHAVDAEANTNTLAVLVLPEKIGNGDIYVFKDASVTGGWCNWNDAAKWEKIGSETNDSWPHNPDDIAIIAFYANTDVKFDPRDGGATLGALYAGGYRDDKATVLIRCVSSSEGVPLTSPVVFSRTDGKPSIVQMCSNSTKLAPPKKDQRASLSVADSVPTVVFANDTILSGGWDGTDPTYPEGRFSFSSPVVRIEEGVTVTLREMDTEGQSISYTMWLGNLAGGGMFWNRSSAMVRVGGDCGSFTGVLRDSGGIHSKSTDRTGPMFIQTQTTTNCTGEIIGWVARSGSDPSEDFTRGVGCFQTGGNHDWQVPAPHLPWFTRKGFSMHGGLLRVGGDTPTSSSGTWTNPVPERTPPITADKRLTDRFSVGGGFNYMHGHNNSAANNIAWFEAYSVHHEGTATLRIRDPSISEEKATNMVTILHGIAEYAIGAGEDPKTSNAASIVPWIVAPAGSKQDEDLRFAAFDASDRLSKVVHSKTTALSAYGPEDNAFVWRAGVSLSEDTTFNSLTLVNDDSSKLLGEGRTMTLTSGGLILGDIYWMAGSSAIGQENGGAANGRLVLGDADHPAYVWARGEDAVSEKAGPNQIWAEVTAPGGLVLAHTGSLVLGGNQMGIEKELVLNAGTLQLGTASSICSLSRSVPIRIFANATLRVVNETSTGGKAIRFDGSAGWFGKVEVAEGVAARCKRLDWRDYPDSPEWENLTRGVYGSSASGAEFVRDDLFSGSGTLEVLLDDRVRPSVLILR